MRVNRFLLPILALIALFGAYGIAESTGFWQVSGKAITENLTSSADIKGWMTLQQISEGFAIPQAELYMLLGLPADLPFTSAMKDLEGVIEVESVRQKIDAYLAGAPLPEPGPEATPFPEEAAPPTATPPALTPTPEHVPQGSGEGSGDGAGTGPTPLPAGAFLAGADIKGRTTLQEIVNNGGIPLPDLLAALGLPATTDPNTAVKDLVGQGNIVEVQTVRDIVTQLQQK